MGTIAQLIFVIILAAFGVMFWRLPATGRPKLLWPIDLIVFRGISLLIFANVLNQLAHILRGPQ